MGHIWNPQQAAALDRVAKWYADPSAPQVFRLFGYAGTGKTTLAKHLAETVRLPIFAAYTGKAASVLRSAGCPNAMTLHSLLYNVRDPDRTTLEEIEVALANTPPDHPIYPELKAEYELELDKVKRPWFYVNPDSALCSADVLICDEVSMVDKKMGADMESFGKKILVLGDPAQLPPIAGGGYFTSQKPDAILTEIHRQAAGNPILQYATMARKGEAIPHGNLGAARKIRREEISDAWYAREGGQVLCGKNETRRSLNAKMRAELGFKGRYPREGERLVCLMNDHRAGFLNGVTCLAASDAVGEERDGGGNLFYLNVNYENQIIRDVLVDASSFHNREFEGRRGQRFDFGYALTVHKAQGSQWPVVTLYDDGFGKREQETRNRWLYTAITRAQETLTIVTS
jgi:exodeoxyribonuclease-5